MPEEIGSSENWTERKWRISVLVALVIALIDVSILTMIHRVFFCMACVGIITLLGMLVLTNFLSESSELSTGELRKSLAASSIVVYFVVLSWVLSPKLSVSDSELAKTVVGHFTYIIGIIVVFYFGSRSVEKYLETKKEEKGQSSSNAK
jgi:hypothetical protein